MRLILSFMVIAGLTACAPAAVMQDKSTEAVSALPEVEQVAVPAAWSNFPTAESTPDARWWQAFQDESLNGIVDRALLGNPEIRIAEARLGEIGKIVSEADPDEQAAAHAALNATTHDANAIRQSTAHAAVITYLEARLAEKRHVLVTLRQQLNRELTDAIRKRLVAGIANTGTLREQEQAGQETNQSLSRVHRDHQQAVIRLASLLGLAPVDFSLSSGAYPSPDELKVSIEAPAKVMEHRQDVQAAWQRLLAANAQQMDDDADATLQIEQSEGAPAPREAIYQKTVLTALHDVEQAVVAWQGARADLKAARDALEILHIQAADIQRAVDAGRSSRVELLKTRLSENSEQENVLLATHAVNVAFAALQLALSHE